MSPTGRKPSEPNMQTIVPKTDIGQALIEALRDAYATNPGSHDAIFNRLSDQVREAMETVPSGDRWAGRKIDPKKYQK